MQEHATIKKLAMDVELVLDVERAVPFSILRQYNTQIEIILKRKREIWNFLNVQELASNLGIIEGQTIDLFQVMFAYTFIALCHCSILSFNMLG